MPVRKNISKTEQQVTFVTFHLGSQTYALPITPVRQIIEMVTITPLPQVNHIVVGVINFHGAMVPVINMRRLLGLPEIPLHLHTPIILTNISERLIGLIVDEVLDVIEKPSQKIIDPSYILLKEMGETPLLLGLIHAQNESILLLNPEHLIKSYNINALTEVVNSLTQGRENDVPDGSKGSTLSEIPLRENTASEIVTNEPEAKPDNISKSRRHRKTVATPEITKEVTA